MRSYRDDALFRLKYSGLYGSMRLWRDFYRDVRPKRRKRHRSASGSVTRPSVTTPFVGSVYAETAQQQAALQRAMNNEYARHVAHLGLRQNVNQSHLNGLSSYLSNYGLQNAQNQMGSSSAINQLLGLGKF